MSTGQYIYRYFVANVLTLLYSLIALVFVAINYLKNPFSSPWAQKLKLEPPARLIDPKYGVHKYMKVNDIKLHYVESGDSSKPLMIFMHGFPEFWYSWRHQIVEFNKDYWCVAVDLRGYGDSERLEGVSFYKLELLIEDIRDLVRKLGREKCILVSHDWGGAIANKVRDVYPDIVTALIMLGSMSPEAWLQEVWTGSEQMKKSWYLFFFRMPVLPELLILMNDLPMYDVMLVPGKTSTDKEDLDCYKYWFRKPYALTPPISYYRANFTLVVPDKYLKEDIPMLVANGANDLYISRDVLERMKTQYAHIETKIIENVGHFLQQEEPEKINKIIRDFLMKHNL